MRNNARAHPLRVRRESLRRRGVLGCRGARSRTLVPGAVRSGGSCRAIATRGFWSVREETLGSQKWERSRARGLYKWTPQAGLGVTRLGATGSAAPGTRLCHLRKHPARRGGGGGGVYLQDVTEFAHMTDVTFKAQA